MPSSHIVFLLIEWLGSPFKHCFKHLLYPLVFQAFPATVGQIHTWLQHLQLGRGLARCYQDEPVQRQLSQLRLHLPAAGGSNDLRVSSPAHYRWRAMGPCGSWWAHLCKITPHQVCVFLAQMRPVTQSLSDCIKVKPVRVMHETYPVIRGKEYCHQARNISIWALKTWKLMCICE